MRLTIVSFSRRKIGGIEQHLDLLLPELERRGHVIQFVYMNDEPAGRQPIRDLSNGFRVDVSRLGATLALERVRDFAPDLINLHGDVPAPFQQALIGIAPSAYSVHNYYGTCISGLKTTQFPIVQPCSRKFGAACLVRYLPLRCGGLSPITMLRLYSAERARLTAIANCDAVITHSQVMLEEYARHGVKASRIRGLPYEAESGDVIPQPRQLPASGPLQVLFVGRMNKLKGGEVLIRAIPQAAAILRRSIELHMAGDGPDRAHWERVARGAASESRIVFHGWQTGPELDRLFRSAHLLAFPSLFPESFGKTGPEAMARGLPVAAFAVGGVVDWLRSGDNGFTAPGDTLTSGGLAGAIVNCLESPERYSNLSAGAFATRERFRLKPHVDALVDLFEELRHRRTAPAARAAQAS